MVNGYGVQFVTEVAPPEIIPVVKHKAASVLDTIDKEEKMDGLEAAPVPLENSSNSCLQKHKRVMASFVVYHSCRCSAPRKDVLRCVLPTDEITIVC
ncbi:unnamed protein product [Musa acuminata var. zebrina]